jgi:hypothetical protein
MGHRILKRVALDFKWPLDKVWKGYIDHTPCPRTCKACDGTGLNPATLKIHRDYHDNEGFGSRWTYVYGVSSKNTPAARPPWLIEGDCRSWCHKITQDEVEALVEEGRLIEFTHEWISGKGWQPKVWNTKGFWCPKCHDVLPQLSFHHYSATCTGCNAEMELLEGNDIRLQIPLAKEVNAWSQEGMGHDCINQGILVEARAKRLGVYGPCPRCKGKGELKLPRKPKKRHKKWKAYEPPSGIGYQLWETCSDGSPVSPVFATAEELADWCEENATIFGSHKTPRQNWLDMFIGKKDAETESMLVQSSCGYIGPKANMSD